MDLCGTMRVKSINGKKYILMIVDDYYQYTWTHFLRFKDETPEALIDFLKMIQRGLQAQVIIVRTDRGTKFLNKTLHTYFKEEGISHQTTIAQTSEQNGIFKRRNRTLVEAARTMLSASKLPLFFWAEAIATAYHNNEPSSSTLVSEVVPSADTSDTSLQELELLFSPMFDEYFNRGNQGVSKSSAISDLQQQDTSHTLNVQHISKPSTPSTNVNAENNDNNQAVNAEFNKDEFINPLCTPTKYHPSEQVRGNPSKPVQIRRQLATDLVMCMFALIMSKAEPKNIKEEMADHAWIEAMQEELHQFDRLRVWELIDKPFKKTVIGSKWLWKNKKDEDECFISLTNPRCTKIIKKRVLTLKNLLHQSLDWNLFRFSLPTLYTNHLLSIRWTSK
ncbi:retrovirus-related pol polyprotein from transposon TNT 1-94 [Tanacetum coccineum]